jgi:Tol biopolymer transport system component
MATSGALLSVGTSAAVAPVGAQPGLLPGRVATAWKGDGELAVASGGQLRLIDNDGQANSLGGPGVVSSPSWSADGNWVAFLRTPAPPPGKPWTTENSALWVARTDGTDAHSISPPDGDVTQFAWGPAGTKSQANWEILAFSASYPPRYISRIYLAAPATKRLHVFASFNDLIGFSWAPGGNSLAISYRTSPTAGFKGILEFSPLNGATPRTLYTLPEGGYVKLATWWPNGKGVVFWSDPAGSASIAADGLSLDSLDVATGVVANLATTLTYTNWLAWSPDGRTLAVVDGPNRSIWGSGKHVVLCTVPDMQRLGAACQTVPLPAGPVVSLEPAWTAGGSLLFVVAPGTKAGTIGPPPEAPATAAGPYSSQDVAAWYNAQQVYSVVPGSDRATVVAAAGMGAHTPTPTPHGLLFVRGDRLWYLPTGSATPLVLAGGLQSPSPYGNYYGYIDWSEDYAWHL